MTTTPGDSELSQAVAEQDGPLEVAPFDGASSTTPDTAPGLARLEFVDLASDPAIGAVCSPDDPDCTADELP